MRKIYLDCAMGAAGDMLSGALLELTENPEETLEELNLLGIPGVVYLREKSVKCGIVGTHLRVLTEAGEEGEHREDDHGGEKPSGEGHSHTTLARIQYQTASLAVSPKVRTKILSVYGRLARAESISHGVPLQQIHFHEVGTLDALADITAFCYLMERLGWPAVVSSPVHVGSGCVRCAHGILPVPAPAAAVLLKDVPIYGGEIQGELCTPTGAALLAEFAGSYGPMPAMRLKKTGYGMGKKDYERMNGVRAFLGETDDEVFHKIKTEEKAESHEETDKGDKKETQIKAAGCLEDRVTELQCNLDDMTAEEIGFAIDRLYEGGALEVFTLPADMKKNRPGTLLTVLCHEEDCENTAALIFRYTETLGIRATTKSRYLLKRRCETVETSRGPLHRKVSEGFGVCRMKYEYDDLAAEALRCGKSLREIKEEIRERVRGDKGDSQAREETEGDLKVRGGGN